MEIKEHKLGRGEITEVKLTFDPLSIWVISGVELIVDPGDKLGDVAKAIKQYLPELGPKERRALVAYWFFLGERAASGGREPWKRKELRTNSTRRYQPKKKDLEG